MINKKFKTIFVLLLLSFVYPLLAEEGGWVDRDGNPVQNTDAMKSINGFGGWLIVTPDSDWEAKWNTPPDVTPHFSEASDVRYGEELTILIFYINPRTNAAGEINIRCDIKITRPDGTSATDAKDVVCAKGKLQGSPRHVRLTTTIIKYIGEPGDPPGRWDVEVVLTDKRRNTRLPLKTHFVLLENDTKNQSTPVTKGERVEEFGRQMSYFYLTPSEDAFIEFQKRADVLSDEINSLGNGADIMTSVMIARISEKYNWPILKGAYSIKANEILAGQSDLAKYVADDSKVNPGKLDIWWASFFATGEEQYLDKIYQFAGLELPKGDIERMLIIGSATWSFKSNCKQHERVLQYAKRKVNSESDPKLTFLRQCIANAADDKTI